VFFILNSNKQSTFNRTNIALLSYVVVAITETFVLVVRAFLFRTDNVCVLCYQPSCQNYLHLAIVFNEMWRPNFASALKTDKNRSATNSCNIIKTVWAT